MKRNQSRRFASIVREGDDTSSDGGLIDDDIGVGCFASPPCFLHELDPAFAGLVETTQSRDVARWRKAERDRLIAARRTLAIEDRAAHAARLATDLDALVATRVPRSIGLYWPIRGEPDFRPWMAQTCESGVRIALPVAVARDRPLVFRDWRPGTLLGRDAWNVPCPAEGLTFVPDVVIAPLLGFDPDGFRLGYGDGALDRTLAATSHRPLVIGVGHSSGALATVYPQPHDIAMDWILVGDGQPRACTGRSKTP